MRLLALSDLHIDSDQDPLALLLRQWLPTQLHAGDTLILGGDVFNLFIGPKQRFFVRFQRFLESLESLLSAGVSVHLLEGNHDFQLESLAQRLPNLHLHTGPMSLELAGKKFWIGHGDEVNRSDKSYLRMRSVFRSTPMRAFIQHAPDAWIDAIGTTLSHNSREYSSLAQAATQKLTEIYHTDAKIKFSEGYDFVLYGHCHIAHELHKGTHTYLNMGYPKIHRFAVMWDSAMPDALSKLTLPTAAPLVPS